MVAEADADDDRAAELGAPYVLWVLETAGQFWCQPAWRERTEGLAWDALEACHRLLGRTPGLEVEDLVQRDLALSADLKNAGRFDEAARVLAEFALMHGGDLAALRSRVLLEAAEVERRRFRWSASDRLLEQATSASRSEQLALEERRELELSIALLHASLEIERGLPDRALPWAEQAEELALERTPVDLARAHFVRMRVLHLLQRFDQVVLAWSRFEASEAHARLAASKGSERRWLAQLATRAAHSSLELAPVEGSVDPRAIEWLEGSLANEEISGDEGLFARSLLALALLDQGDVERARGEIASALAELPPAEESTADNRRIGLASIDLLAALEARAPAAELRGKLEDLEARYAELLSRWGEGPTDRQGRGLLQTTDRLRILSVLFRARLELQGAQAGARAALELLVREQAVGSLSRTLGAGPIPVERVQRELCAAGGGILAYVPARRRTHVFLVDASDVRHLELPEGLLSVDRSRSRYLAALLAMREEATEFARAELRAATEELSAKVLPSSVLAAIEGWTSLRIVGDETLGYLPFEGLDDADGAALGAHRALSYLPSFPVAAWLAEHRPPASPPAPATLRGLRVICPAPDRAPAGQAELPEALAFDPSWYARLADTTRGHRFESLLADEATLARLEALEPSRADYLHVLAHGIGDVEREDPRGLLLAAGDVLWGTELERISVSPTVLLTACSAGGGLLRRGDDGRQRLSGACFVAGARTVILPRLDIEYGTTLRFTEALERGLFAQGLGPAEAARRARAELLARTPDDVDAFLLHVVGLADTPLTVRAELGATSSARAVLLVALGGGLVLALASLVRRRRRVVPARRG